MHSEQNRTREHVACVRAQAEVVAAIEACDLILSRLRHAAAAFDGMCRPSGVSLRVARELADCLGGMLDELVERDPGAPGEEWPDEAFMATLATPASELGKPDRKE